MRVRVTDRDPNLPHQISLVKTGDLTAIRCNCRHDYLGVIHPAADPWPIYNDPDNHRDHEEKFIPRAHHTANAKVYEVD